MLSTLIPDSRISNQPKKLIALLLIDLVSGINTIFLDYIKKNQKVRSTEADIIRAYVKRLAQEATQKTMRIVHFAPRIQATMIDDIVYEEFFDNYNDFSESFGEGFYSIRSNITSNTVVVVYERLNRYLSNVFDKHMGIFGSEFGVPSIEEMEKISTEMKIMLCHMELICMETLNKLNAETNPAFYKDTMFIRRFIDANRDKCDLEDISASFMNTESFDPVVGKWMLLDDLILYVKNTIKRIDDPRRNNVTPLRRMIELQNLLVDFVKKARQLGFE